MRRHLDVFRVPGGWTGCEEGTRNKGQVPFKKQSSVEEQKKFHEHQLSSDGMEKR
ncbi:hypothetical protein KSF_000450 [Reticulibacter mediterranei]|uniref:Uncharacterized protein n=1 Tax=Reticulibacter mediterranei TaxID=2778369 RepID=A0A8J3IE93_9CHLR|nr:hypothetical protein KSF_000450 [Reticulibacter mediterranei]